MKVLNIHTRILPKAKSEVVELLQTLSTNKDEVWPLKKWPRMKFKEGIKEGAKGGHGPIHYSVEIYKPSEIIQFRFSKPTGFKGIHKFDLKELGPEKTEIKHTIDMETNCKGSLLWLFAIRALHNALIEDGFDKMESTLSHTQVESEWNIWVKFLRKILA